jgi:LysM repeat protein
LGTVDAVKGLAPLTPSVLGLLFGVVLIVLVGFSVVLVPGGPTTTEAQVIAKSPVKTLAVVTGTPAATTVVPTVAQAVPPTSTAVPPTPVPTAPPTTQPSIKYIVVLGDTMGGIAEKYGLSSADIVKANNLSSAESIREGQELTIPPKPTPTTAPTRTAAPAQKPTVTATPAPTATAAATATPAPTETAAPTATPAPTPNAATSVYIVQPGDTLFGIAEKVGVPAKAILAANNISENDILSDGQKLTIPAVSAATPTAVSSTQESRVYVVESGDTLLGIANKLGVDADALKRYNGLNDADALSIGQKLKVP